MQQARQLALGPASPAAAAVDPAQALCLLLFPRQEQDQQTSRCDKFSLFVLIHCLKMLPCIFVFGGGGGLETVIFMSPLFHRRVAWRLALAPIGRAPPPGRAGDDVIFVACPATLNRNREGSRPYKRFIGAGLSLLKRKTLICCVTEQLLKAALNIFIGSWSEMIFFVFVGAAALLLRTPSLFPLIGIAF